MSAKHTPGPWSVTARANNMIDVIHSNRSTPGAITLALCRVQARQSWLAEAEANARLIAAAPDLLEALIAMKRATQTTDPNVQAAASQICAEAIRKAIGDAQ